MTWLFFTRFSPVYQCQLPFALGWCTCLGLSHKDQECNGVIYGTVRWLMIPWTSPGLGLWCFWMELFTSWLDGMSQMSFLLDVKLKHGPFTSSWHWDTGDVILLPMTSLLFHWSSIYLLVNNLLSTSSLLWTIMCFQIGLGVNIDLECQFKIFKWFIKKGPPTNTSLFPT